MEKFSQDEKILVLMELPPKEVILVCESSKEMNLACRNVKYSNLWKHKIQKDFNIDCDDNCTYEKYKFLEKLYRQKFYVVRITDTHDQQDSYSKLFDTREKAEKYIWIQTSAYGAISYAQMTEGLNTCSLQLGDLMYSLDEEYMYNNDSSLHLFEEQYQKEKEEYENEQLELAPVEEEMREFIADFNADYGGISLKGNNILNQARARLNRFIQDVTKSFPDKNRLRELVLKRILVDKSVKL